MVTATHLFFQVLRVQLWTTGFDSQLALRRQRNRARAAHEAIHTHLAPLFRHSVTSVTSNSESFSKTNAKPLAPPSSTLPMGAMRSSINACQKIVKTKYYPNCLNLRNCVSCLPARASSLSAGKIFTTISPFFWKFLLAQASFSATFLVRVAGAR